MRSERLKRLSILGIIVLSSCAVALLAERFGSLTGVEQLELQAMEFRQRSTAESRREGADRGTDVLLVFFDSASVESWDYLSPFPRAVLADLIDAVSSAGATAIGVDVYLDRLYPGLNALDAGDDRLRESIARAGNVFLVARTVVTDSGPRLAAPHPYFADAAAGVAAADLANPFEMVLDGTLAVRSGAGLEPSLALALYAQANGLDVDSLMDAAWAAGELSLPGLPRAYGEVPPTWLDGTAPPDQNILSFPVRFVGPPSHTAVLAAEERGTFPAYASSVVPLVAPFTPDAFQGRLVLLGTGFHDSDKFRTPFSGYRPPGTDAAMVSAETAYDWTYGVEIHANALQNMLDAEYVRTVPSWLKLLLLLTAAVSTGGIAFWAGAGLGGLATLVASAGIVVTSFWAWTGEVFLPGVTLLQLDQRFLALPLVTGVLAALLSYVGSVAYVSVVEGRDKRFIKSAFGKYVSPDVVEQISSHPEALQLGGQKRTLSILFSDLAGFTDLSERMDPQDLIAKLNEYLTDMTRLVLDEEGTLDKYIGDAIMAFWNAPTDMEDHATRALRCAVVMQRRMRRLNGEWLAKDPLAQPMSVRIGINTGEVVVGNVGGKDKFDYSAIGDAVNLAARLEPANKTYGTLIMASEHTLAAADAGAFRYRELDRLAVKGKAKPVTVYEILEESPVQLPAHREEVIKHYEAGLRSFRTRDWELAARYFEAALEADETDGPSRVYLERCREYAANPPPADWDFVVRRTVK